MRGKADAPAHGLLTQGITPAYAGKSAMFSTFSSLKKDHPRVCGEKGNSANIFAPLKGSPPRMRGKERHRRPAGRGEGITPAYAGKSHGLSSVQNPIPGSPPRMRGKVSGTCDTAFALRITPAYAGKRLKRSHSIGHFSCILRLFHSVLHRASASGGSRAGPCAPPCLPAQNAVPV